MASAGNLQRKNGENDEEARGSAYGQEWSDRRTFFSVFLPQSEKLMTGGNIVLDLIVLGVYDDLGMLLK